MHKVLGVVIVVLAIAIAVVPMFTDCQSQGKAITLANGNTIPMKCHWTGVAELGMGIPLVVIGGMMAVTNRRQNLTYLGILGLVIGAVVVALPTKLIGVCATPTMSCVTLEKPALIAMGSVVMLGSLAGLVWSRRMKDN